MTKGAFIIIFFIIGNLIPFDVKIKKTNWQTEFRLFLLVCIRMYFLGFRVWLMVEEDTRWSRQNSASNLETSYFFVQRPDEFELNH